MTRPAWPKPGAGSSGLRATSGRPSTSFARHRRYWTTSSFHCQQAADKSLKGFVTWHDRPFCKTHSIEELGEQCLQVDPTLKVLIDRAVPLTEYAWKFRYPGEPEEPSSQETEEALATAREVYAAIVARLPVEARP